MCIDLHIHSHYSDGTSSPARLVEMASACHLSGISLTDHDTVEGTDEFLEEAKKLSIEAITGLEISSTHREYSLHLLGYGINHQDGRLRTWLEHLQQGRKTRNEQILAKMQKLGLDIHTSELETLSCCGQTGRPHIARLLMQKKIVSSVNDAFRHYLRKGSAAWVSRFTYPADQSIAMIHQAGGLAVLAHPGQITPQPASLPLLIGELVERGLDGIEIYYPGYSPKVRRGLTGLAARHKLVITGGSDYHGYNKSYSRMASKKNGFCPPDSLLDQLIEKIGSFKNRNFQYSQ